MKLKILDKSNYFKGLLLLIGKDKKITEKERDMMMRLGRALGFDRAFVEESINNLFENEYIKKDPPVFSNKSFAKAFLKDGIRFAFVDDDIAPSEYEWLNKVACENKIDNQWLNSELRKHISQMDEFNFDENELEVINYLKN